MKTPLCENFVRSGTTILLRQDNPYLLSVFRNCGYPLPFIRRSMRRKILRGHGQRENSTPEAPSEDQRTNQDSEPRWTSLTYIPCPTPAKPQHQSGTQTYGHLQNYPGESQRHHPSGCKGGHAKEAMPNTLEKLAKHYRPG